MATRLRVGVIGLGRHWRKYLPVFAGLRRHLEISAVCHQVADVSERTARRLGCVPAGGPVDLLDRDDVNALLLLGQQWYGLWPLELACRLGKPTFCGVPLVREPQADVLHRQIQTSGVPVMMGIATVLAPALLRLRHLLSNYLGPVRLLRIDRGIKRLPAVGPRFPDRPPKRQVALLDRGEILGVLEICATLFDSNPSSIWTTAAQHSSFASLLLEFGPERLAQLNLWIEARPTCRVQVVAEKGHATALLPRRLLWRDPDTHHQQRWPRHPLRQTLLQRFALMVRAGQPAQPSFQEAYQALIWLRAAQQSQRQGRRVFLTPAGPSPD